MLLLLHYLSPLSSHLGTAKGPEATHIYRDKRRCKQSKRKNKHADPPSSFPSTTTFLLRCAVECGAYTADTDARDASATSSSSSSSSLGLAWELLSALRRHRDTSGWDLGDICLAQHEDVVRRLVVAVEERPPPGSGGAAGAARVSGAPGPGLGPGPGPELQVDVALMAELFPGPGLGLQWDSGLEGW